MDNMYADRWGTGGTGADLFALAAEVRADVGLWKRPRRSEPGPYQSIPDE